MAAALRIKRNLHFTGCSGARRLHITDYMPRPVAVYHKWDHCFSIPVLAVQKCPDSRSHRIPPGRRSRCNHIILLQIHRKRFQLWFISAPDFFPALLDSRIAASCVRHCGVNFFPDRRRRFPAAFLQSVLYFRLTTNNIQFPVFSSSAPCFPNSCF